MFSLKKKINVYYISYFDQEKERDYFNDVDIAEILKIDMNLYRTTMMEIYDAYLYIDFIYFLEENKAQKAFEWVEMVHITNNKLS